MQHLKHDHGDQRTEIMERHSRLLTRPWVLPVSAVVLIAGPAILYYILSHVGLPAALVSGVIILMVIKHLGLLAVLLGPLYALFRRRFRQ
jgi:hypothetical protein